MKNETNGNQELQILNQSELLGRHFTVYGTPEQPLFLARDVAEIIEHSDVSTMVRTVDPDEKLVQTMFVSGQNRDYWFLTEDGLYEILMQSRKPIAKEFKRGVKEILKSIRKHGAYMTDEIIERTLTDPDYLIRLATELKNEKQKRLAAEQTVEKQTKQLDEQKPKVEFYDAVTQSKNTVTMECAAKLIKEKPFNVPKFGRNKLFAIMRETGVFFGKGRDTRPYQKHIDSGCFELAEYTYRQCGANMVGVQIMVTQKGLDFILKTVVEYFRAKTEAEQQQRPIQLHFNI